MGWDGKRPVRYNKGTLLLHYSRRLIAFALEHSVSSVVEFCLGLLELVWCGVRAAD